MLWMAGAVCAGVSLAAWGEPSLLICLVSLAVSLLSLWAAIRYRYGVFVAALGVLGLCGMSRAVLIHEQPHMQPRDGSYEFEIIRFSDPSSSGKPGKRIWTTIAVRGELLSWCVPDGIQPRIGNHYRSHLIIEAPLPDLNPRFLAKERRFLEPKTFLAFSKGPTVLVKQADDVLGRIDGLRQAVARRLSRHWSGDYLGVALALGLGSRAGLSEKMKRQWNELGISHLLAISGLHMGFVGFFLFWVLRFAFLVLALGRGLGPARRLAALGTLLGMWMFCGWVGAPVSALRACLMASVVFGAIFLKANQGGFNALGVAAGMMVLGEPGCLFQVGFWLSFGCTGFLLLCVGQSHFSGTHWYSSWLRLTTVPWLATVPICAFCFGEFYALSVPANLFSIAVAGWVITPAALLTTFCCGWGWEAPAWIELAFITGIDCIHTWLDILSTWPWVSFQVPWIGACLAAVLIWPALFWWLRSGTLELRKVSMLVVLGIGVLGFLLSGSDSAELKVHMPYVGHGDAVILELPDGPIVLVDAGGAAYRSGFDPGARVVAPLLRRIGRTHIDYVLMSHPDFDHIGGFHYLLERFTVGELWLDDAYIKHPAFDVLIRKAKLRGAKVVAFQDLPDVLRVGLSTLQLVYPRRADDNGNPRTTNQRSLVIRVEVGKRSILLTGDVDAEIESILASRVEPTELLKVPHHGSKTSSSDSILNVLRPCLAIVSSGRGRRGNFPHKQIVDRYQSHGVPLFQTRLQGALTLSTIPSGWRVDPFWGDSIELGCPLRTSIK